MKHVGRRSPPDSGAVKADFTTVSSYDELGRLVKTVAPKVKAESNGSAPVDVQPTSLVGYGAFGQVTSSKDALVVKSRFGKLGRQVEVSAPSYTPSGGSWAPLPQQYGWENASNRTKADTRTFDPSATPPAPPA
ncbi:hypothetical protein ACI2LF_26575 [Kribbella sp. NPDC020789]